MLKESTSHDHEPAEVARARKTAEEAQAKLERYLNAIEKAMDPTLYVERSRTAQAELATARAVLEAHRGAAVTPITERELRDLLRRVGGAVGLLQDADRMSAASSTRRSASTSRTSVWAKEKR